MIKLKGKSSKIKNYLTQQHSQQIQPDNGESANLETKGFARSYTVILQNYVITRPVNVRNTAATRFSAIHRDYERICRRRLSLEWGVATVLSSQISGQLQLPKS